MYLYYVVAVAKQLVKEEGTGNISVNTVTRMTKGQSFGVSEEVTLGCGCYNII